MKINKNLIFLIIGGILLVLTFINYFTNPYIKSIGSLNKKDFQSISVIAMENENKQELYQLVEDNEIVMFLPPNYCSSCEEELIGLIDYIDGEATIALVFPQIKFSIYNQKKMWCNSFDKKYVNCYYFEEEGNSDFYFSDKSILVIWENKKVEIDNIVYPEEFMKIYEKACELKE